MFGLSNTDVPSSSSAFRINSISTLTIVDLFAALLLKENLLDKSGLWTEMINSGRTLGSGKKNLKGRKPYLNERDYVSQ